MDRRKDLSGRFKELREDRTRGGSVESIEELWKRKREKEEERRDLAGRE